jgi:hypothetical protein
MVSLKGAQHDSRITSIKAVIQAVSLRVVDS